MVALIFSTYGHVCRVVWVEDRLAGDRKNKLVKPDRKNESGPSTPQLIGSWSTKGKTASKVDEGGMGMLRSKAETAKTKREKAGKSEEEKRADWAAETDASSTSTMGQFLCVAFGGRFQQIPSLIGRWIQ
jgi:hypothetical protein